MNFNKNSKPDEIVVDLFARENVFFQYKKNKFLPSKIIQNLKK